MSHEYEAKFLRVDPGVIRESLKREGAVLVQPERLMRRKTFDFLDRRLNALGAWVRVRDEGDKVTMSYKQVSDRTIEGMIEEQVVVDDFERACGFLMALGLMQKSVQENRRETWHLDGCEVVIDWWPWILPLVEIEGVDEASIRAVALRLGFDWSHKLHGGIEPAYEDAYQVASGEVTSWSVIQFGDVPPALLAKTREGSKYDRYAFSRWRRGGWYTGVLPSFRRGFMFDVGGLRV